jgi:hypothetical protein
VGSGTAAKLVNVLRWGGIEVEQATAAFTAAGKSYPARATSSGPRFRPHLTDLLNPQVLSRPQALPDGPPEKPYDITGWTFRFRWG